MFELTFKTRFSLSEPATPISLSMFEQRRYQLLYRPVVSPETNTNLVDIVTSVVKLFCNKRVWINQKHFL